MLKYFSKSLLLLTFTIVICCIIYPLALWVVGEVFFPFQAKGSIIQGPDGKQIGSKLIAQSFTKDEYFHPRPSAAFYDAAASASSSLAPSNIALRDRAQRLLATIVRYKSGSKQGKPIAPDIEQWFQEDKFQGKPHIVAQWANLRKSLAKTWAEDPLNRAFIDQWTKEHPHSKTNNDAVSFFQNFSEENPGKFPSSVIIASDGKTTIEMVSSGLQIQSMFFDMWLQDHPDVELVNVPGDMVLASASGLDPHISLANAKFQMDRVAATWALHLKRDSKEVATEIEQILMNHVSAPFAGLAGEKFVNVLEVNLELHKHFGKIP